MTARSPHEPVGSGAGEPSAARHRSAVDCSEALLRVFEFLDGEMAPSDRAQIRAHLAECAECLNQYDLDQMVKVVVKRSCVSEPAPVRLRSVIMQRLTVIRVETGDPSPF
jgi:anti-sigma factor (TIGR02949 family)